MKTLKTAIDFAMKAHSEQKYGFLPYYYHLIEVSHFTDIFGGDETHRIVAWLHDTIEDTDVTHSELLTLFGKEIADAVAALSKDGSLKDENDYITYYEKIANNKIAVKVKLADRIANMKNSVDNAKFRKKYQKEYHLFKKYLYNGENQEMWDTLDGYMLAFQAVET